MPSVPLMVLTYRPAILVGKIEKLLNVFALGRGLRDRVTGGAVDRDATGRHIASSSRPGLSR